jgi:hypothetical protein
MTALGAFNTQLIRFFKELSDTYPEEKGIRMALEGIEGAKKVNPKLILDMFHEYVCSPLREPIEREDEDVVVAFAKKSIESGFNDISPALLIFDKHWPIMSEMNQKAIWNYLKVLCILCERARQRKEL